MANDEKREDVVIQDHNYDGIREYDNPMPGWWIWMFWVCVAFAPIYVLGVHFMDFIPTYEDDLAAGQAELQAVRDAYEAANPSFIADEATLAAYYGNEEAIAAGAATFSAYCAVCHGAAGEGLIGPNLTDEYWVHGRDGETIYRIVTEGVLEKGMTPWGNILSGEARAQVVAFVRSLEGTSPPNAKAPEGAPYVPETTGDEAS